jgi:hypothetical protein
MAKGHTVALLEGTSRKAESIIEKACDADVVIDPQLPVTFGLSKGQLNSVRPYLLSHALENSGARLIVTSSSAVLGDTGPVPVGENAPAHPPQKFAWIRRMEKEVLRRGAIVIRPAIEHHYSLSMAMGNMITLALRFRQGKYIGSELTAGQPSTPRILLIYIVGW